ncbi:MAG: ABC transporter permease, partial [Atopostipes suicloacalis]|nr:ABC transporter permease [Atopostipes suicloacalis]
RSLIVRLNVFAVIFIFLSNSYLLSLVFTLIFIYLLGFQLISLIQMNQKLPQFKILPVDDEEKITSSLYLMNQILLLMTFLIGITAIVSMGWKGLSIIPVGILMSYLFSYYYVPYRLKSNKRSR